MNLGKSENSYLKKFQHKKDISNLKPYNKKEKHIIYHNIKDWEELNYEKENDKIIPNNLDTSTIKQADSNVKPENKQFPNYVFSKEDSPNSFSINTSMFTNKYNEFTDKIDFSQMNTSYQPNINNKNLPPTQAVDKLDACNSYKDNQYQVIEEKEEFKINQSTSKGNKLIEIDGNLIITDRSIMDEFDSLYLEDSLDEIDDKFNKEKSQPSLLKDRNKITPGIDTNKDVYSQNKIDQGMNKITLKPIINHSQNYNGANSNEISDRNQKKNRKSSPYIRSIPSHYGIVESESKNSDSYLINPINNDSKVMYYPSYPFPESVINNNMQANSLYYYSDNLLNQNNNTTSFYLKNIASHQFTSNETFNSVNTSNLQKSCSTSNTIYKKEHSILISNSLNTNRTDTKNISINNFKKSCAYNKDKKEYNSIMSYRPYSCKDSKSKIKAVRLKPLEDVRLDLNNKKDSEGKKDKPSIEKVRAALRPKFNLKKRNDDLKVDLINVSVLISPKSKVSQDMPGNRTVDKNNGYSHIHSIKRLQSAKKHEDSSLSNANEIKNESRHNSIMRPKSSRLDPLKIDIIKNTQKMFSKVYTTLHDNKRSKNTNDTNTDFSVIYCPSNLVKIRPNSSRPHVRLKIKKDKDDFQAKENSIETLLEKNKILNEKVEKIKNYFNSKIYK